MILQGRDLKLRDQGDDVKQLQIELISIGYRGMPEDEWKQGIFGEKTQAEVARFQSEHDIEPTGIVDVATARAINQLVKAANPTFVVEGKVASQDRAGVGGLRVAIVDKDVGQDVTLVEVTTSVDGAYRASFPLAELRRKRRGSPGKEKPDLQVQVYAGSTLLGTSEVRYNATPQEVLHVLLDEQASAHLPSEHEMLTSMLATHYQGSLHDLQETDQRQDITYLANKTGWDARAVALAALADRFSQGTSDASGQGGVPPAFFYALFRAGVPANEDVLYHTGVATLTAVWQKSAAEGLIPASHAETIPAMVQQFQARSAQKLLDAPALVGASSVQEMLVASGLKDNPSQEQFARLYAEKRSNAPEFWKAVESTFPNQATRLQVNAKLGFLTINNASLVEALHKDIGGEGVTDPLQLAQAGYHRADKWTKLITSGMVIPKEIPGDTLDAKQANYKEFLAAQVRLSYPTASIAEMVNSEEFPLTGAVAGAKDAVHRFLTDPEHQGKFEIEMQPIQQYIAQHDLNVDSETVTQIQRLQRVIQITPTDQAMAGLMRRGIDAAYRITGYQREEFVQAFAQDLGGEASATQTYDRSVQVHNAVLNIAMSYLTARNGIGLGALPLYPPQENAGMAGQVLQPAPKSLTDSDAAHVVATATLEKLFGSMDYCSCDHCRSILSPAAYLVDLLHSIEVDQAQLVPGTRNPQTVLLDRRPDIQHLPLTCENTNTAVPYIDLVNEMLEYFVANKAQNLSLKGYEGHDTNGVATEDLLASPQFVNDLAYQTLAGETFPTMLPFNKALETLRRCFKKFEVPLPLAMERLRNPDALFGSPNAWRDILIEELGVSQTEYFMLVNPTAFPLGKLYGFPDGTPEADIIATLSNAEAFTRRVEITYDDIVAILATRFVNPHSDLLPRLERLGVSFGTLKALKEGTITDASFDAKLPQGAGAPDPAEYAGEIKAWVRKQSNYDGIMGLITLTDPTGHTDVSRFDALEFRYARPMTDVNDTSTRLGTAEFARLMYLIRLWKKTGWTIEQTDATICALYRKDLQELRADDVDSLEKLGTHFPFLLFRLGHLVRVMKALNLTPKRDLLSLLACWTSIGTHGDGALYRQMFLNPSLLAQDPVFGDDGYGEFLTNSPDKLSAHSEALRAAFSLTGDEFDRIVAALPEGAGTPLTLPNISAVYRRGWLAHKLQLSVHELLLLIEATDVDPFASPDPVLQSAPAAPTGSPEPPILRLIALVQALKERSLKPSEVLYLIWNRDLTCKAAPDPAQITEIARTLRGDCVDIEGQFAVKEDPGGGTARAQMALVYGQEVTDTFISFIENTLVVDMGYTHSTPKLDPAITQLDPQLVYDDFRHRLSHTGVLTAATREALNNSSNASLEFKEAVGRLFARGEDLKFSFFTRHPELLPLYEGPLYEAYLTGSDSKEQRQAVLLANLFPELKRRRKRQQALQRLGAAVAVDPAFAETLLDAPAAPYPIHAVTGGRTDQPALNDILAAEIPGLFFRFWYGYGDDVYEKGPVNGDDTASSLDYAPVGGNPLPSNPTAGEAISCVWRGLLEAPEAGFYNLFIEADAGASVTLFLDEHRCELTHIGNLYRNSAPLELKAGSLYSIRLVVQKVRDVVSVKWETPKRPREVIPGRYLYSPAVLNNLMNVYIRFVKAASLAARLRLTAAEISYFATHADYQTVRGGWLNLPATQDGWLNRSDSKPDTTFLLKPLQALLDFARLKAEISPEDERLLDVLRDPQIATIHDDGLRYANSSLYTLTRWDLPQLTALLKQFGRKVGELAHFDLFCRVFDAFALADKMGISAGALINAATNQPTGDTVRDLLAALRARYSADSWRDLIQPINDEMRELQRNALVAYVLHQNRISKHPAIAAIDTADKLFEYFLVDVEMSACMQTSRIRHALSSVQLFIERCLMNLEPDVSPRSIDAKQWAWMKRYRVWEANRKVFLFPENWLEPELRDDKSPFFKELESELLQSDITEDSATTAFLNYLAKLEEVAKLEPCGIYHQEGGPSGQTRDMDHVIARTAGAHRKYYYRRYEYGYWTPWEQIKLDIEDNPVMPYVWNGRLLLFWLRIMKQAPLTGPDPTIAPTRSKEPWEMPAVFQSPGSDTHPAVSDNQVEPNLTDLHLSDVKKDAVASVEKSAKVTVQAVLCWSEYYNGKWQAAKTSDINNPATLDQFAPQGQDAFNRSKLALRTRQTDDTLWVDVDYAGTGAMFHLFNTHSLPVWGKLPPSPAFRYGKNRTPRVANGVFTLNYDARIPDIPDTFLPRPVLTDWLGVRIVEPHHPLDNPWDAPFFFEDSRHIFYVTTSEQPVTVGDSTKNGILLLPQSGSEEIPRLVKRPDPYMHVLASRVSPEAAHSGASILASTPVERFVSEDAFITRGIGMGGTVRFEGREIGVAGTIGKLVEPEKG